MTRTKVKKNVRQSNKSNNGNSNKALLPPSNISKNIHSIYSYNNGDRRDEHGKSQHGKKIKVTMNSVEKLMNNFCNLSMIFVLLHRKLM